VCRTLRRERRQLLGHAAPQQRADGEQLTRDFNLPADIVIAVAPCPPTTEAGPELRWSRTERTIRVCSGLVTALDALIRPAYIPTQDKR